MQNTTDNHHPEPRLRLPALAALLLAATAAFSACRADKHAVGFVVEKATQRVEAADPVEGLADPALLFSKRAPEVRKMTVTATGYAGCGGKCGKRKPRGAWGDTLTPYIRAVAVSQDLLKKGLGYRTRIIIQGLEGEYTILDKMPRRWKNKIDIYFGDDHSAARRWGKRTLTIYWEEAAPAAQ